MAAGTGAGRTRRAPSAAAAGDWVFSIGRGAPCGHRNVAQRVLRRAADTAQFAEDPEGPA